MGCLTNGKGRWRAQFAHHEEGAVFARVLGQPIRANCAIPRPQMVFREVLKAVFECELHHAGPV